MSQTLGPVGQQLEDTIRQALSPSALTVIDQSHLHAGHVGARPEGETHFRVEVSAPQFAAMSRLERQRAVMDAASELLQSRIHALEVKTMNS